MKDLYKYLLDERDRESQRYWQIFSVMSFVNGGLLVVVTAQKAGPVLSALAAILGIALCIVWLQSLRRLRGWLEWWEGKLQDLEPRYLEGLKTEAEKNKTPGLPDGFKLFVGRKGAVTLGISTRTAAWLVPLFFGLAWVAVLCSALAGLVRIVC
jgi:hypothetical protein